MSRRTALLERLRRGLAGDPGEVRLVRAPGRVNLIGEHTDYTGGLVMPAAISREIWIASLPAPDGRVEFRSGRRRASFELGNPGPARGSWIDYAAGVSRELATAGIAQRARTGIIDSRLPIGAGLSSSAALGLGAAWTLLVDDSPPTPLDLARLVQRAENDYVGVRCGLMDQFAVACGQPGRALLLDCRSLDWRPVRLPPDHRLVILDSRRPRELRGGGYNQRRVECEAATELIRGAAPHVRSLRDVDLRLLERLRLPAPLDARARHVVTENERVLRAASELEAGRPAELGSIFAASHASLRDDFEVSCPELDALVEIAAGVEGVAGARMTGAGFGGCTVNLVHRDSVAALRRAVAERYPRASGLEAGFYVVDAVAGAGLVES